MALQGQLLLAIWNDVAPRLDAHYNDWHTREHVPERVAAPGFFSGTRYRCAQAARHAYLTLYDVLSAASLESPAYRDLLSAPTAASAGMRPHLRNVLRLPLSVRHSTGMGTCGHLAVVGAAAVLDEAQHAALARIEAAMSMHVTTASTRNTAPPWLAAGGSEEGPRQVTTLVFIETLTAAAATSVRAQAARILGLTPAVPDDWANTVYELLFRFPGAPGEAQAHRRAHWPGNEAGAFDAD